MIIKYIKKLVLFSGHPYINELRPTELEIVSAAGCCVCLSCWHPIDIFDKTPYPSLHVNYPTEAKCIAACNVLEHACGHNWYPNKKCNQVKGRVEEL
jgi:hypothetical protein